MSDPLKLDSTPFSEAEAFAKAQRDVWARVGNFCYPVKPRTTDEITEFQIWADIPRIYTDPVNGLPRDVHFFRFKKVGYVRVSLRRGTIEATLNWMEARQRIREQMDDVETSVEKALLKTCAAKFSELPFAEHMHTPIVDILSTLIYDRQLDFSYWADRFPEDEEGVKLREYVSSLERAELVRVEGTHVYPGNFFLSLERRDLAPPQFLRAALSQYFESGINQIESIRRVIGPQLRIASKIYETGLEWGVDAGLTRDEITTFVRQQAYTGDRRKELQVPRYLIQLQQLDLVTVERKEGAEVFRGTPTIFDKVRGLERILAPFRRALTLLPKDSPRFSPTPSC